MASSDDAASTSVSPGLFMLPLPINKDINIDRAVVETKVRDLHHFLRVRIGRSEEFAILNLQGLLTLRIHRYEEALSYFHAVLAKDSKNLNALANLQYVLEKLFRLAEAERCKDELSRLLQSQDSESQKSIKARCLAEQAYAYAYDIHSDTLAGQRYMDSNEMYRRALDLGGKAVNTAEKDDWKLCIATNAHKLFDNLWYEDKKVAATEYIDIAVKLFYEIARRSPGDPEFQWDSWRHLADIFRAFKIRKISKEVHTPQELQEYKNDPEKCMLKAMEVTPNNARLLARYANFLYSMDKASYQKPLELLEQSISLDSTEFNFYAFTTRAMINIKYYTYHVKQPGQDSLKMGLLRNALQLAKSDFEKAMAMHVTPWDLARLGEVYFLLAKNHTEQDSEVRSLIEKALLHFTKAADCQDGHKRIEVHLGRGRCLFAIGEKRSAIGCFKQATDCEPATSKYTGNFNELLSVYLSILREENSSKDRSIYAETAYSLRMAVLKYGVINVTKFCVGKFRAEYAAQLEQLAEYCDQFEELNHLASLLRSEEPVSPNPARIETGGKLQGPWTKTYFHRAGDVVQEVAEWPSSAAGSTVDKHEDMKEGREVGPSKTSSIDAPEEKAEDAEAHHEVSFLTEDMAKVAIGKPKEQPIKKAPEKARVSSFKYDFFVVYPEKERDWVSYDLLVALEEIPKLKGCTLHRDATPGQYETSNEIKLMESSANILLIHTEEFIKSKKCEYSMQQALNLRRSKGSTQVILPILRDASDLPDEIRVFKPFDATGAVDWSALAHCIEQQIAH